jgi:hypothetical protein
MDMEIIYVLFLIFLRLVAPVLIIIVLIWFFFVGRRIYKEKKSFDASKGDEVAMSMEKDRIKARLLHVIRLISMIVVAILAVYLGANEDIVLVVVAICGLAFLLWAEVFKKRYNANFKEHIVKAELSKVLDNLQYEPQGRFDNALISGLDFFKKFDDIRGNDLINADYKGLHFAQCDMGVQERYTATVENKDGSTREEVRWRDIFKGRVMRFDFADKFRGRVQVVAKEFPGTKIKSSRSLGAWQSVETELAEFARYYDVYALDPIDAMAALTPQVIESVFYLKKALDVPIALYFIENTMVVFILTNREAFDVSGKHTLLEERILLQRDIALVTGFMDVMYFKAQGAPAAASPENTRSETAAAVAAAIGPSKAEKLVRKTTRGVGKTLAFLPIAVIAVFLVSAVYGFLYLPDHIAAGTSPDAPLVPTIGYMAVAGFFIIIPALSRHIFFTAVAMAIHLLFMSANL